MIQLERVVADLTDRIETSGVLFPLSDRKSPVDAKEFHDRPCRRPPTSPTKPEQTNIPRQLQEECLTKPSTQRSRLNDEPDTPAGV